MEEHGLGALLDLFCVGYGSYGFNFDVPALYGLWFVSPAVMVAYLANQNGSSDTGKKKVESIRLVRQGFSNLWRQMVKKHKIDIRYNVLIRKINRNLSNPQRPITIELIQA